MDIEIPKYKCHKEVRALKIESIQNIDHKSVLVFEDNHPALAMDIGWMNKHNPQPGGYYVIYEDGYTSYSPSKAFEEGYTLI